MNARLCWSIVALGACIATAVAATRADRSSTDPVFAVRQFKAPDGASATVQVDVISFSPARADLLVMPPAAFDTGMAQAARGLSVRASVAPLEQRFTPAQTSELLIVNGGFSGSRTNVPVGLLISSGRMASTLDQQLRRGNPDDRCAARRVDRLRYSAVLCAAPGKLRILAASREINLESCRDALQSAPILVEDGKPAICPDEADGPAYLRTALCQADDTMHLVVTAAPIHLFHLAEWLATPATNGGLGCRQAMNLSGDTSSGAVLLTARGSPNPQRLNLGPGNFPLPSLIVVQPRRESGRTAR